MNIGEVAKHSGVSPKTIRYYESIGLISAASRSASGYRQYGARELETLRFVRHARGLGFSVEDVAELLALWRDRERSSADVKAVAGRHLARIERKLAELQAMRGTLEHLMARCHGDERPDCPIIDELAESGDDGAAREAPEREARVAWGDGGKATRTGAVPEDAELP